jgi:hypothetical protein
MALACRFGHHKWTSRVQQGTTYTVCSECGKERGTPKGEREIDHAVFHSPAHGQPPGKRKIE